MVELTWAGSIMDLAGKAVSIFDIKLFWREWMKELAQWKQSCFTEKWPWSAEREIMACSTQHHSNKGSETTMKTLQYIAAVEIAISATQFNFKVHKHTCATGCN